MNAQEQAKCDFCEEIKPVLRHYVRVKNKHFDDNKQGCYSRYFKYCNDCGIETAPLPTISNKDVLLDRQETEPITN